MNSSGCSFILGGRAGGGAGALCAAAAGCACLAGGACGCLAGAGCACLAGTGGEATPLLGGGAGLAPSPLRSGGFGRLLVESPVVSVLYGPEGFGGSSICCCCCCCCSCVSLLTGVPTTLPHPPPLAADPAGLVGVPFAPYHPLCFGGGPKESGSFRLVSGALWCDRCAS